MAATPAVPPPAAPRPSCWPGPSWPPSPRPGSSGCCATWAYLSFWMDEGFHYLAAEGILKHGYPLYPSGHIYWKAILYAYVLAGGSFNLRPDRHDPADRLQRPLRGRPDRPGLPLSASASFPARSGWLAAVILALSAWEVGVRPPGPLLRPAAAHGPGFDLRLSPGLRPGSEASSSPGSSSCSS